MVSTGYFHYWFDCYFRVERMNNFVSKLEFDIQNDLFNYIIESDLYSELSDRFIVL